jgi:hypothetical protein
LQTFLVVGLLAATMGAAGVFAVLDCPCNPFRREYRLQEIDKLPPEPPPPRLPREEA